MRLRHIEIFSAIMRTGSTIGAARLLNVSQPAISKMLQHAERTLGFALFVRAKGKLVPTAEALRLEEELRPFDDQLARIRRVAATLASGREAPLRIAATSSIAHHMAPVALSGWGNALPQAQFMIIASLTREMVYWLLIGEIDIGFTMQQVSHPNINCSAVCEFDLYAIAPAGWWPKKLLDQPVIAKEFEGQPFVSLDLHSPLGASIVTWLGDVQPDVKGLVQTYTVARSLVEAGVGIAVVDEFTAKASSSVSTLQMRKLDLAETNRVYALTNQSRPPPQSAEVLLKALRASSRTGLHGKMTSA